MAPDFVTGSVPEHELPKYNGEEFAVERVAKGKNVSFIEMEEHYKKPGGTLMHAWFGADPFDYWFGRFYVGTFGIVSLIGIIFGTILYFYQAWVVEGVRWNILQARIDPPPISAGLGLVQPNEPGFFWQLIVFFATIAFLGWMMRQVDIARKLDMSYEVPIAFGAVVSSWITLQFLRPIAMGAWGNGFALGITHHLDWVSNIGYQYFNFFFNPFHAIGITLLFTSTLLLGMHGSVILMSSRRPYVKEDNEDGFWRNLLGYSVGEVGIHRLGFWVGAASVLFSNLCIFLSGTLVHDWSGFWAFYENLPTWEFSAVATVLLVGSVIWRGRPGKMVDPHEQEYGGYDIEGTALKRPFNIEFMRRLFANGQVGPIHVGIAGVVALVAGTGALLIILQDFAFQVDFNIIQLVRNIWYLETFPPAVEYGLGFGPGWHEGGAWFYATALIHVSVIAWAVRIYQLSRKAGFGPHLTWSFGGALFLYFVIYLIRPVIMGNWAQAPAQGFVAVLEWTNVVSVQTGNFYYNPFHMLSIFFLLGSTLLLAMHGATIVATSKWGSHHEVEEMMAEGEGTHRAQLYWRWCMGWQANSKTIHDWSIWFAAFTGITGGIGLLLSGTVIQDWFVWAQQAGIVAPPF